MKDQVQYPLQIKISFSSQSYTQVNGNYIYINPMIVGKTKDNPFKQAERIYSIDFNCNRQFSSTVTVKIPSTYEIKEVPSDRKIIIGTNDITYARNVLLNDSIVQVKNSFIVKKTQYPQSSYQEIQDYFGKIVNIESDQIVLQKKVVPSVTTRTTEPVIEKPKDSSQKQRRHK